MGSSRPSAMASYRRHYLCTCCWLVVAVALSNAVCGGCRSSVRSFVRFLERIQTRRRREEGMKVNGLTCWLRTLTLTTMHLSCCCCFYRRRRRTVGFCPFSRSFLPHPYSIPYPLHKHWACRCTVRGVLSFCRWPYKFNESLSSPSFSFIVSAIVFMPHNH